MVRQQRSRQPGRRRAARACQHHQGWTELRVAGVLPPRQTQSRVRIGKLLERRAPGDHDSGALGAARARLLHGHADRKSTRLNSSHRTITYAVFCLKKKTLAKLKKESRRIAANAEKVLASGSKSWYEADANVESGRAYFALAAPSYTAVDVPAGVRS